MDDKQWPKTTRIVHLPGGTRAINELSDKVTIVPRATNGSHAEFKIPTYGAIFHYLLSIGLIPLGAEFITSAEQASGIQPTEWRTIDFNKESIYTAFDARQIWGNLRYAAHKSKNYQLADLAGRIGFQIEACEHRIKEISDAYNKQLMSLAVEGNFDPDAGIESQWTFHIYFATHSFFVDCCILRDYIAEYISVYALLKPQNNITTLSGLIKYLRSSPHENNEITTELRKITDPKLHGWLAAIGDYRNLIAHSSPLSRSEGRTFLIQKLLSIQNDNALPSISYAIPENPRNLIQKRSQGEYPTNLAEWIHNMRDKLFNNMPILDALNYCHTSHNNMMDTLLRVVQYAPIKPVRPVFTEGEVIIKTTI